MMSKKYRWTKEEIEFLKQNYNTATWDELISNFKNRTKTSIRGKAKGLKLRRNTRWTKKEIEFLQQNYKSTPWEKIISNLNRTKVSIKGKARGLKLKRNFKWTKKEIEFLRQNYYLMPWEGLLYNLQNRTKDAIEQKAHYLGFKRKPRRTYNVNEEFFNTWSPQMAYILGYIAADGSLQNQDKGSHSLLFGSTDWQLLIKIKKALNSEHFLQFSYRNNKIFYLLRIGSEKIVKKLLSLGILPCANSAKTKYQTFPYVPKNYLSHFIRGNLDGDGCIHITCSKYKYVQDSVRFGVDFLGTNPFLKTLSQIFNSKLFVNIKNLYPLRGTYCIKYSNNEAVRILDWLYKDADIYLPRKFKIYKENRNMVINKKRVQNKYIPLEEVLLGVN